MTEFNTTQIVEDEVMAKIVKDDEGNFKVIDKDGTIGDICKFCDDGDKTIVLTPNASNRKWYNRAKAEKEIAENGFVALYYKSTKQHGPVGSKLPNEKLISYLSAEEQEEYKAIIARAIEAKNAAKAQPLTAKEKLEAKIAKLQAKLEELGE